MAAKGGHLHKSWNTNVCSETKNLNSGQFVSKMVFYDFVAKRYKCCWKEPKSATSVAIMLLIVMESLSA